MIGLCAADVSRVFAFVNEAQECLGGAGYVGSMLTPVLTRRARPVVVEASA